MIKSNESSDSGGYQALIEIDGNEKWVRCPYCLKRIFPITPKARIEGQVFKCKGSDCKRYFEVNYIDE